MSCTIPTCTSCKHFKTEGTYPEIIYLCDAFTNGIPEEWFWKGDPKGAEECNKGIGFESKDGDQSSKCY